MDLRLEGLLRLQEIDGRAAELQETIAALPKRLASLEQTVTRQKHSLEQAEQAVHAEEAKRRRLESDLRDQQQKLAKYREQSSSVKTNEQFHALQHELGFVEAEIRRIEDAELTSMVQSETLEAHRTQARREIANQLGQIEQEKQAARADSEKHRQELDTFKEERARLRADVDPSLLAEYDRLASSSRKTALARASEHRCMACQMALRPQFWNEVRSGTLLHCESCGRLLYFDPDMEPNSNSAPEVPGPMRTQGN